MIILKKLEVLYLKNGRMYPSLKEGLFFLTNYTMNINQNDYHYWEGPFKGLLPKEILELSDEDFQTLYEAFEDEGLDTSYIENLIEDEGYEENEGIEGKVLKQAFEDFLCEIDSHYSYYGYFTLTEIKLFRSLSVNKIEQIDFDDKGICWTYNAPSLYSYIEYTIVPHNEYLTRFYGTTPIENIDWIESFFLYINYSTNEKELRVYDSQKVFLKGYVNINYSTMREYSKGGETSYLLDGIITKEDFLKNNESLLKEFLYNPQTNRYDYNGDLDKYKLINFISEDGDGFTINFGKVTGNFDCSGLDLTSLKGAPQEVDEGFNCSKNQLISLEGAPQKVRGWFYCSDNQFTSLEGAPQIVGENFVCSINQLTSLEGAPQKVGGDFYCSNNQLTSLKGAPQKVGGEFYCSWNKLTSLEGAPKTVGRRFICSDNQLTSLKGAPQEVGGDFSCSSNKLTSLEGAPKKVGGNFSCFENQLTSLERAPQIVGDGFFCFENQLTSLEGAPQTVGGNFSCFGNQLTSLEGAPQTVGGDFYCNDNQLTSLEGAPREVGEYFNCSNNPNLHSLDGIGKVTGKIYKDF